MSIDPILNAVSDIRACVMGIVSSNIPIQPDSPKEYEVAKSIRDIYAQKCYKIKTSFKTTISENGATCFAVKRLSKCPYGESDSLSCQTCKRFVDFTATANGNGINFWCLSKETIGKYEVK